MRCEIGNSDKRSLREVERERVDRYSRSYRVICAASAEDAVAEIEALAAAGEGVALVLAAQSLGRMMGGELLGKVRDIHAHAQRGLLIEWGSWGDGQTAEEIFEAMARRQIEYYVIRPSLSPDELFHQGSMNRVASAVGEGSIAIKLVHELFAAEQIHPRDRV